MSAIDQDSHAVRTITTHLGIARPFLAQHLSEDGSVSLTAADVSTCLQGEVARRSPPRAKHVVRVLRALLRYLFQEGYTRDLSPVVLTVRDWRLSTIPKSLPLRRGRACARRVCTRHRDGAS